MIDAIITGFVALFVVDNYEFLKTVKEQRDKGYEWKYVGYTEYNSDNPAIVIRDADGNNPHIYWRLVKPEDK